jgi:glucosamine kinase
MMQLGIDAGATRTKWSVATGGQVLARGDAPALTGHVFTEAQIRHARSCLAELRDRVHAAVPTEAMQRVVAGVTGLDQGEAAALTMVGLIAETFGVPPAAVTVQNDLWLTYRAYHQPGEGVLLYAGTGSIAFHLDKVGGSLRAGGYGFLLGDEGGALWMAREALRRLLRERDEGKALQSDLAREMEKRLGDLNWATIRAFTYGQERGHIAQLAPAVTTAAAQGDPVAIRIQQEGAVELARLARCVLRQAPDARVVTATGGAISEATLALVTAELAADEVRVQRGVERASDANALLDLSTPGQPTAR